MSRCPLCQSINAEAVVNDQVADRIYWNCVNCDLIYMDQKFYPSIQAEKDRYKSHENMLEDEGYLIFLNQFVNPLLKVIPKIRSSEFKTLDYGSGPGPVLGRILDEKGLRTWNYDLYFSDDKELLNRKWDLIVSTEVWEHFRSPEQEILKIKSMLKPGGNIGVMTQFHKGASQFKSWWYVRDFTHLVFYSEKTFQFISNKYNLEILYLKAPVAIFKMISD